MKTIYVLAAYPTKETLKDGMVQRIAIVDNLIKAYKRIYINIDLRNPIFKTIVRDNDVHELLFNPFFPFFLLTKFLLKADTIYSHSIHPFKHMPYSFFFIKKRKIKVLLDAHGVVPEEIKMYGKNLKFNYLNWIEKKVFNVLQHCICVSNEMIKHYKKKYETSLTKYHLFFTSELMPKANIDHVSDLAVELNIKAADCVIMYCGNLQRWQNIPLMISVMKEIDKENIKFIVLTGEKEKFINELEISNVSLKNIIIRSVKPSELNNYYELAHFGMILRDDIPINRVSNPTKMLEYLQFGLVPIVLSPFIGDYYSMGYEHVSISSIKELKFLPVKSEKNVAIAQAIGVQNNIFNLDILIN